MLRLALMELSDSDLRHVADLARLGLKDEEIKGLRDDMTKILSYVGKLDELDTDEIDPTTQVVEVSGALRDDEVTNDPHPEDAVAEAAARHDTYYLVPSIIE